MTSKATFNENEYILWLRIYVYEIKWIIYRMYVNHFVCLSTINKTIEIACYIPFVSIILDHKIIETG